MVLRGVMVRHLGGFTGGYVSGTIVMGQEKGSTVGK